MLKIKQTKKAAAEEKKRLEKQEKQQALQEKGLDLMDYMLGEIQKKVRHIEFF